MTVQDDAPPLDGPTDLPHPLPPRPRPSLAPPFGWGSLTEEEKQEAAEEAVEATVLGDLAGLSPGGDDWPSDEDSESLDSSGTSSPASSAEETRPVTQLVSKHQLRQTAAQAVKIGGGMAHTVAAKTPEAQHVGLYLADDDDARAIGHPLADIMHRRGDVVGGKLSPDANSALQAFLGLAGYLTKQVTKVAEIRELQRPQGPQA